MGLYNGREQQAECQRSGKKCRANELVRDGRNPQLLVLPEWADPYHPQEHPYSPDDQEGMAQFAIAPDTLPATGLALAGTFHQPNPMNLGWNQAQLLGPRAETYRVRKSKNGSPYTTIFSTPVDYTNATLHVPNIGLQKDYGHVYYVGTTYSDTDVGANGDLLSVVTPSLLLHFDGSFVDSSAYLNVATLGANTTTTQGATVKFGSGAAQFAGVNGVGLSYPIVAGGPLDFSNGDYNFELYYYVTAIGTDQVLMSIIKGSDSSIGFDLILKADGTLLARWGNSGGIQVVNVNTGISSLNAWHHVSVERRSGNSVIRVDGSSANSSVVDISANSLAGNTVLNIGGRLTTFPFAGKMDEVRLIKGAALYISNFAVPVTAFVVPVPSVSYLVHLDGTLVDSSVNALSGTNFGVAFTNTNQKFGTGALEYAGTAVTYIEYAMAAGGPLDIFQDDFTIEFFFRLKAAGLSGSNYAVGFGGVAAFSEEFRVIVGINGGSNCQGLGATASWSAMTNNTVLVADTWYHCAACRVGSSGRLFINGVGGLSTNNNLLNFPTTVTRMRLGCSDPTLDAIQTSFFNGDIDEVRITKGGARYFQNFTPPAAPFSIAAASGNDYDYAIEAVDSLGDAVAASNIVHLAIALNGTGVVTGNSSTITPPA